MIVGGVTLNWTELAAGAFTVLGAAIGFHYKARKARSEAETAAAEARKLEVHDALVLALNNGAGEIVGRIVKSAITDALDNHQIRCPLRPLVESHERRIQQMQDAA